LQQPNLHLITTPCDVTFNLSLRDGTTIELTQVVRVVPKKRLVCVGVWQNQLVYAKIFLGEKSGDYAARDAAGVKALQQASILTPTLLGETTLQDTTAHILIFKAMMQAENVEVLWAKSKSAERLRLAKKLASVVGLHHQAKLLQTDLYLKNFLLDGDEIVTLDGDGIRQFKKLSDKLAIDNFSILLSKFDVLEVEVWLINLLESYQIANPLLRLVPYQIRQLSNQQRIQAASRYADKKVFRQCTDVNVTQSVKQFAAVSATYANLGLPSEISTFDTLMASAEILKNGRTCTVATTVLASKNIVIKRYNIKHVAHQLGRLFRPTRAAASWANAHRLQLLGIATPSPVALIEARTFGLRGKAYFLSEYVDAPDIAAFFAQTSDKALRAEVVKNVVELFYRLHFLKISHGDMKASNIKVLETKPMLIDLDSMKQHYARHFAEKTHARDLHRFMQNWKEDASLYNAFVKTFKVIYADHTPLYLANILK
jgi:tRNA A-37 threonylcarbamoyl transferase component Bud32